MVPAFSSVLALVADTSLTMTPSLPVMIPVIHHGCGEIGDFDALGRTGDQGAWLIGDSAAGLQLDAAEELAVDGAEIIDGGPDGHGGHDIVVRVDAEVGTGDDGARLVGNGAAEIDPGPHEADDRATGLIDRERLPSHADAAGEGISVVGLVDAAGVHHGAAVVADGHAVAFECGDHPGCGVACETALCQQDAAVHCGDGAVVHRGAPGTGRAGHSSLVGEVNSSAVRVERCADAVDGVASGRQRDGALRLADHACVQHVTMTPSSQCWLPKGQSRWWRRIRRPLHW